MPQLIEVPGMGQVEFPDGMSDAAISAAIKHNMAQQPKRPAQDVGVGEAMLIGAGRTFDQMWDGGRQLFHKARGDQESLARLASENADETQHYKALQQARPVATGVGEALPYAAVPARSLAALAGITGLGESVQYGTNEERAARGLTGAASGFAGGALGKLIGGAINPVADAAKSASKRAALAAGERIGIQPRMSEVTGSPFAARMEDFAARIPGGAGVMRDFAVRNQAAVNRAAAASIGQKADELTPEVFAAASSQLGRVFEEIKSLGKVNIGGRDVLPIALDSGVKTAAENVIRTQMKLPPSMRAGEALTLAQQAQKMASLKGRIDGEAYQLIRSNLTDAAHTAFSAGSSQQGKAYQSLLGALDDAAEASLKQIGKGDLAGALRETRPLYANLKMLEKGTVAEAGNVSAAKVAGAMRTQNPKAFREGATSGPLDDIARYGEAFKPLQAGSPTFERTITSSPVTAALAAGPAWLAAKATTSPVATWYPRNVGGTTAAEQAARLADPVTRALLFNPVQGSLAQLLGMPNK